MKKMIVGRDEMGEFAEQMAVQAIEWQKSANNTGAIVFGLKGDLGSGKTTFTQRFCGYFDIKEDVTSPTFVIQKSYRVGETVDLGAGKIRDFGGIEKIYHIDAYRLESPKELEVLGFKKILEDKNAVIVIEWPEKVADLLPPETKYIDFTFIDENTRAVEYNWANA